MKKKKMFPIWFVIPLVFACLGVMLSSTSVRTSAADSEWQVKYWNNKTLSGNPVLQREESNLSYDWGSGSPAPGIVNADNFSARWLRTIYFSSGSYRFTATTDDGMRVWIDGVLIIDSWQDSAAHTLSNDIYLYNGDHEIKVKYYEAGGQAVARLSWTPLWGPAPGTYLNWKGEYFNNTSLSGQPVLVRDDPAINFDWGGDTPAWGIVGADRFSVRWTRTLTLQPGCYRLTTITDDGVRLWINGQLVINQWHDSIAGTYSADVDLPSGSAAVQMEYYENMGGAVARLNWERLGSCMTYNWRGEYYNNAALSGTPALIRDDASINFNWSGGSPAAGILNSDNFSVRWTRSPGFENGRYRFTLTCDDGVRLWVNNQLLLNEWYDHAPQTYTAEIDLTVGPVPIRLEFYEHTGGALVHLNWSKIATTPQPAPIPAPTPTAAMGIVLSDWLNVRTGPGMQYGIIAAALRGRTLPLVGYRSADGYWVMVDWNGTAAWVSGSSAYLWTNVPVSNMPIWQGAVPSTGGPATTLTARVAYCYYLNMRTGPGLNYRIIKAMPAGTTVTMIGRDPSAAWIKVRLADGTVGWMSAGYLLTSQAVTTLPAVG